jgi:hypothetical protein
MRAESHQRESQHAARLLESQSQLSDLDPNTFSQNPLGDGDGNGELSSLEDRSGLDSSDSTDSSDSAESTGEPLRSGRVKRPSCIKASQLSQDAAAARLKADRKGKGKGKGRKARKSLPTSQLLEEFSIDLNIIH